MNAGTSVYHPKLVIASRRLINGMVTDSVKDYILKFKSHTVCFT